MCVIQNSTTLFLSFLKFCIKLYSFTTFNYTLWTTRETSTGAALEEVRITMEDKVAAAGTKEAVAVATAVEVAVATVVAVEDLNMEEVAVDGTKAVAEVATAEVAAMEEAVASIRKEISKKKGAMVAVVATEVAVAAATVVAVEATAEEMVVADLPILIMVEMLTLAGHLHVELLILKGLTTMVVMEVEILTETVEINQHLKMAIQ